MEKPYDYEYRVLPPLLRILADEAKDALTINALTHAAEALERLHEAVRNERERCASIARDLHDAWIQAHGRDTAYDAGRCTALENVEEAIQQAAQPASP